MTGFPRRWRNNDLILEKGWLMKEKHDDILKPENMTQPREWPALN